MLGHYKFSQDETERKLQLDKIKNLRKETEVNRDRIQKGREKKTDKVHERRALVEKRTLEIREKKRRKLEATQQSESGHASSSTADNFLNSMF